MKIQAKSLVKVESNWKKSHSSIFRRGFQNVKLASRKEAWSIHIYLKVTLKEMIAEYLKLSFPKRRM